MLGLRKIHKNPNNHFILVVTLFFFFTINDQEKRGHHHHQWYPKCHGWQHPPPYLLVRNLSNLKPNTLESPMTPFCLSPANLVTYPFKIYPVSYHSAPPWPRCHHSPWRWSLPVGPLISLCLSAFFPSTDMTMVFLPLKWNNTSLLLKVCQWLPISFREKETLHNCLLFAPTPTHSSLSQCILMFVFFSCPA